MSYLCNVFLTRIYILLIVHTRPWISGSICGLGHGLALVDASSKVIFVLECENRGVECCW